MRAQRVPQLNVQLVVGEEELLAAAPKELSGELGARVVGVLVAQSGAWQLGPRLRPIILPKVAPLARQPAPEHAGRHPDVVG